MPWSRELAQLPTPTIATRTLSLLRGLPLVEPLLEAMLSFRLEANGTSSASLSARRTRSLTCSLRRRASPLSSRRSSGGMRRTTAPAAPAIALRRRPLREERHRDVVQVGSAPCDLADERALERAGHADEHARPLGARTASSQSASTLAHGASACGARGARAGSAAGR